MPQPFHKGEMIEGFIGIDGGSTSTKAVLISKDHKRRILAKTYQLSKGNPIEDTVEVLQKLDRQIRDSGRGAEDSRRRHHRVRQGHPEGRGRRRCGAGRDRGAHRSRPALLRRRGRDLRRRRPGHQDHHPEERPRQRFQAEHAVFGGQRLLPAIHRAGLQREGGRVRRRRVRAPRASPALATAARCSCRATSWTSSVRAGSRKRSWPACATCCPRTSGCTFRRFRISPRSARASCCRAARSTIWPPSKRRSISSNRALRARIFRPTSSCTSIAAKPERSAPRWKPDACGITGASAPSSGSTPAPTSSTRPRAKKPRAATSARTSACARSSTSRPTRFRRIISARRRPRCRWKRARNA